MVNDDPAILLSLLISKKIILNCRVMIYLPLQILTLTPELKIYTIC